MMSQTSRISFWTAARKTIAKLRASIQCKLLAVLLLLVLALCSCSFPPIQTVETAPPETPSPTASPQETPEQSTGKGDISALEPYLACLGATPADISSSFSSSPFEEWEYCGWDGGAPYFIDEADRIVYFFVWLEEPSDDPLVYLTADTKCVQINFPCSQIYDSPSDMSKADLEEIWGQPFLECEDIENEMWWLYTELDGHYEVRISCTEELLLTEHTYICIIDRSIVNGEDQ